MTECLHDDMDTLFVSQIRFEGHNRGLPSQKVIRAFDVFFVVSLNQLLRQLSFLTP